ncbi:MAG TPA: ectonucleotide pyrophosphatase/phosphodiesterase [Bryobacteraceae bacterium]
MKIRFWLATGALILCAMAAQAATPGVVLISIDGMRPDYVTHASEHGLKIPHLLELMHSGAYATGVHGVLPTVTYPSHTTLLTGVWPAQHGIDSNTTFDPLGKNMGGWYWYSEDNRAPTLWKAAADAGLKVGSVSWPVSVSATGVHFLIPEYWRASTDDDLKLERALSTPGLLTHLQKELGPYIMDLNRAIPGDRQRTRYSVGILKENRPDFMTIHLAALDHLEHLTAPFSKESNDTLEELDGMVGKIEDAMRATHPEAVICIVSDHGFARIDHELHLFSAFVDAGLVTLDPKAATPKVMSWKAIPWNDGGSAAIMLQNPGDQAVHKQTAELLARLAADPANGIAAVLDEQAIAKLGGSTRAAFWVDMKSNFAISAAIRKPLVTEMSPRGTHGYSPDNPDLLASFFIAGPGIRKGLNLGQIDMRSIAPTLAHFLGVPFPSAALPALDLSGR